MGVTWTQLSPLKTLFPETVFSSGCIDRGGGGPQRPAPGEELTGPLQRSPKLRHLSPKLRPRLEEK